jgi:RNA polymerase primary sigma factor
MANQFPPYLIETVNRLIRTSSQMMVEIGREPTTEELAERLSMPLEKVAKLLDIARRPITIDAR